MIPARFWRQFNWKAPGRFRRALAFLASLNSIGFPLVVDSVQLITNNTPPGRVKMNLTIIILDFSQQKEVPHA
ncbi:MAG: hypothetical protein WDN00_02050 [Limisphaerales bacterium]